MWKAPTSRKLSLLWTQSTLVSSQRLCDEQGAIRSFVNLYVNGEDVRFLSGLDTDTKDGDEISIVPAVAGG